ncbi:MAG: hypothetical protein OXU23_11545, partial [Candidatus Poribacteria bacterium]|nr:hypothetical protein [Candidatus Poribacteria bacterium]
MQEVTSIGNVSISAGWENNCPVLLLKNHGQKGEMIELLCLESGKNSSTSWKKLHLPFGSQLKVELPKYFKRWEKFGFLIGEERLLAPVSALQDILPKAKGFVEVKPSQPETEPLMSEPERAEEAEYLTNKVQKPYIESAHVSEFPSINYKQEAKATVQQTNERVSELAHAYKDGEAIDFVNIENPTLSQNILLILNWVASTIREWKIELEQSGETDRSLIETLTYSEQDLQEKLKAIRGEQTPLPDSLELETNIASDTELNEIRKVCSYHVAWFEGRLFGYEERSEIKNIEEYNQFIPQFIKDRLFNGVSRFVPFDQLPEQLEQYLQLVGYEIVPIELGKTQADARVHDVQGSRQTNGECGTVVE